MKKGSLAVIVVFVAVSLALTAFARPGLAAESKHLITLKHAEAFPAAGFYYPHLLWWKDQVERRTDGRVTVRQFFGGSLSGWPQALKALQTGLADIAQVCPPYFPSEMPLSMISEMVGLSTDLWVAQKAATDLYNEDPYVMAEQERLGLKPIFTHHSGLMHYGFRSDVRTLADMNGKIVRTYGGALFEAEKRMGLKSVFMSYSDIYEALARGTIDGTGFTYIVSDGFRHWEKVKTVVEVGAGYSLGLQRSMRLSVWKKLPPDIQSMFMKLQSDWIDYFSKAMYAETALLRKKWLDYGVVINEMTPEDRAKMDKEILPEAQKAFVQQVEKMPDGERAKDVWAHYQKLRDKYQTIVDTKGYPWAPKKVASK
jgi:TRAP-type C4-dicarboxylate transport system substrate-binding protein